jgi:hypothetical protein
VPSISNSPSLKYLFDEVSVGSTPQRPPLTLSHHHLISQFFPTGRRVNVFDTSQFLGFVKSVLDSIQNRKKKKKYNKSAEVDELI